jgi:hypothetical protein
MYVLHLSARRLNCPGYSSKERDGMVTRVLDLRAILDLSDEDCLRMSTNVAHVPSAEVDSSLQLRRGGSFKEIELSRLR